MDHWWARHCKSHVISDFDLLLIDSDSEGHVLCTELEHRFGRPCLQNAAFIPLRIGRQHLDARHFQSVALSEDVERRSRVGELL
jgi:hypothetical protein